MLIAFQLLLLWSWIIIKRANVLHTLRIKFSKYVLLLVLTDGVYDETLQLDTVQTPSVIVTQFRNSTSITFEKIKAQN